MLALFFSISTAYEILSDEQKRKNYDLYGDETGNPGFGAEHPGGQGGYNTYFTGGGPGQSQFNFRPGQWQDMGGQGGSQSFSFSYGGSDSSNSFGFGLEDIFGSFFGGGGGRRGSGSGSQFGGFGGSAGFQSGSKRSPKSFKAINSQIFKKEIVDQGMTWLLLSYTPSSKGLQHFESTIEEVASSLQGAIKVSLCYYLFFPFLTVVQSFMAYFSSM